MKRAPQHGGKKPPHHHQPPPGRGKRMTNPLVPGGTVKRAGHHKKRSLALGEGVACCSAEALAASLRLAGGSVSDEDVLALHYLAGGTENGGTSILAALEAASEFGLAGVRPGRFAAAPVVCRDKPLDDTRGYVVADLIGGEVAVIDEHLAAEAQPLDGVVALAAQGRSLILGATLPGGPHAITVGPDGAWWSWGEPYPQSAFSAAVIEEAWTVRWR